MYYVCLGSNLSWKLYCLFLSFTTWRWQRNRLLLPSELVGLWWKALIALAFLDYWLLQDTVFCVAFFSQKQGNLAVLKLNLIIRHLPMHFSSIISPLILNLKIVTPEHFTISCKTRLLPFPPPPTTVTPTTTSTPPGSYHWSRILEVQTLYEMLYPSYLT